jgi:hypothetical protein
MTYQQAKAFIAEALLDFGLHSDHAVELMLMIAAHESLGFKLRRQLIKRGRSLVPAGKGRGVFQMEPLTHDCTWKESDTIRARARRVGIEQSSPDRMIDDDRYAIFVARHFLLMDKNPLPRTVPAMAAYCKSYWNRGGSATPEEYLRDYNLWREGKL